MSDINNLSICIYLLFMFICICHDITKRNIPYLLMISMLILGIPIFVLRILDLSMDIELYRALLYSLSAFLPGICIFIISYLSDEAIGRGDAYYFLLSGLYIGIYHIIMLLIFTFMTSALFSMFSIVYGKINGISMRGKTIPLLPCMLTAIPIIISNYHL